MVLVLAFGVVLLVTVGLSGLAARSVLSTALVFLVAGALVGPAALGFIDVSAANPGTRGVGGRDDQRRARPRTTR
jgi:sodium/hydrogen antiporter